MKQIRNEFAEYYYLTPQAEVFNAKTNRYIKADGNNYKLKTLAGSYRVITKKNLYKLVYNKVFCEDNIEDLKDEIWKVIDNTDGNYLVSNYGRVKSYCDYKAKIIKEQITSKGYIRVAIVQYGKKMNKYAHKLVAEAFLERPTDNKEYQVHHLDSQQRNNKASNLKYLSIEEHIKIHNERK